jgi:hypothetical protein
MRRLSKIYEVWNKPEIDRIVFANHSQFTRVKPRIVRNIESSFFIFVITNEQYVIVLFVLNYEYQRVKS